MATRRGVSRWWQLLVRAYAGTRGHPGYQRARSELRLISWAMLALCRKCSFIRFPSFNVKVECPPGLRGQARLVYLFGEHFDPELSLLSRIVSPQAIAVDVGAFYGYYTTVLASIVGPQGHVLAFEPSARARRVLERNLKANGLQAEVHGVALAESSGVGRLVTPADPSSSYLEYQPHQARGNVSVLTLDSVLDGRRVEFLKLDVEGLESRVLKGGEITLRTWRPLVRFESLDFTRSTAGSRLAAWELLRELAYTFGQVDDQGRLQALDGPPRPGEVYGFPDRDGLQRALAHSPPRTASGRT
jgi:FkbM family methyltransferase